MRTKLFALIIVLSILLAACAPATPAPAAQAPAPVKETVVVEQTKVVEKEVQVVVTPTAGPNPEAVIQGVEPNAELTIWTFWLKGTFDNYILSTIDRFEKTYPGVKVKWEDHQGTFQDDLRNSFAAGNAPDVVNLSVSEGWVSDFATQGKLLALDDQVPQSVVDSYFPGLWNAQMVDGKHYMFPYYNYVQTTLINKKLFDKGGLKVEDFPKKLEDLPAFCKTIKEKTGTLCDIRLTVNDLLAQMVYEGNVKIFDPATKKFTFDSPEAVAWLQMYVDMVKAGTVDKTVLVTDQDRVGFDPFVKEQAAFYNTSLIAQARETNPALYGYLVIANQPAGKSGVTGKGGSSMAVTATTKYPKAAVALAQFFTNAQSNLDIAKMATVFPSTPASYDDPFFTGKVVAIEDGLKPITKTAVSQLADIVPAVPNKADVNDIVLQAIQKALFSGADPQKVLTDAVTQANALPQQ